MDGVKTCNVCKQTKPVDAFSSNKRRRDGRDDKCRECNQAKVKAWQRANPSKHQAKQDRYKASHIEKEKARHRRYAQTHREQQRKQHQEWRKRNPEKARAASIVSRRRWYQKHREESKAYVKRWQEANRDRVRASARKSTHKRYWSNPEKSRLLKIEAENIRRARKHGAKILKADLQHIMERDGMRCHICHRKVSRGSLSFDHVMPLAKGGEHSVANLRVAHRHCN